MQLVAATNNAKKLAEIQRILAPLGFEVRSLQEEGLDIDPEETGTTFAENARIKAVAVCAACGKPTVADDSGLAVDALGGAPGVYSARYAGGHGDDEANNQKLLEELGKMKQSQRSARFISAVCLALPNGAVCEAEGASEGEIGDERRGTNGFGYDPLFYRGGKSYAELTDEEKDAISHRGAALRALCEKLPAFLQGQGITI